MSDVKKDIVEHGGTVLVTAAATGSAVATGLAAVPGTLLGAVAIVDKLRARRVNSWWTEFVRIDGDPPGLEAMLEARPEKDERLAAAIISGARAAADAVADDAIPPIALLTRVYQRKAPPLESTLFRGMLRMLSDLDRPALQQLARFGHLVAAFLAEDPRRTRTGVYVERNQLWEVRNVQAQPVLLGDLLAQHIGDRGGPHTRRMFRILKAQGLADDATLIPSSVPSVDAIAIEREVVDLLVAVLPVNPPPPTMNADGQA